MTSQDIRTYIQNGYGAHQRGDVAFFANMFADDIEWTLHGPPQAFPVPNLLYGKRAVLEALKKIGEALNVVRNVHRELIIEDDRAAVISDRTVVQRDTGRMLIYRVAVFLRFRNEKLVSCQSFYDSFDMIEQLLGKPIDVPSTYPQ
jgi:ketosteroid isomerase-like protein